MFRRVLFWFANEKLNILLVVFRFIFFFSFVLFSNLTFAGR